MKMKRLLLSLFALVIIGVFTTRANCTTDDNVVKKEIVVNQDKSDYFAFPQNNSIFIIGKTNRDEIQNQMRLKFARKLQKRNVTEKSRTSYSQKWLSNVN